jgi:cellobiose epimerase
MTIPSARIRSLQRRVLSELCDDILPFWLERTPDHDFGGFVGAIRNDLSVEREAHKGVVLNARILWTFARAYRLLDEPGLLDAARRACDYFVGHFVDPEHSGVYWLVDFRGNPVDTSKKTYAQAFACFALAEYGVAAADAQAAMLACTLMETVVVRCRDAEHGGYFETFSRDWKLSDDQRLSGVDLNEKKSMNAHLHLLEACAGLTRAGHRGNPKKWLRGLIDIHLDRILDPRTGHLKMFFAEDWSVRSTRISFGHDIEGSWLLREAAEQLGDEGLRAKARDAALAIAQAVYREGRDGEGAILYEADPSGIIDGDRHWWPQAEAVVGFLNAWELSGDERYFEAAENCWEFIERRIIDRTRGEWFWKVSGAGIPDETRYKVDMWKCPYHNSRACIESYERLHRLAR